MIFDLSKTTAQQTYNLLIGLVAPRPIAWITSVDLAGKLNAAPFSAYNYVGTDPPIVAIGVGNRPGPGVVGKDTAQNIRNTREFVINVVNEALAQAMVTCAIDFPPGVNELEIAHLNTARRPSLRCRESWRRLRAWNAARSRRWRRSRVILGQVVAIHVILHAVQIETFRWRRLQPVHGLLPWQTGWSLRHRKVSIWTA